MNELNRNTGHRGVLLAMLAAGVLTGLAKAQNYNQPGYGQQGYNQQGYGQQGYDDSQAVDPPSRVARVSVVVGNVSIEPASVQQFNVAETNYPMTTGDRIYADTGANAEIQTGQLAVRMGQQTDLTVTAMTDVLAQFGLAQGSVHLRSYNIYQGEAVELDTPNVAVTVLQAGDVRVDVDPNSGATVVRVMSGQVQVNGNGVEELLEPGERMSFQGSNPVYAQPLGGMRPDGLDKFSLQRDSLYLSAFAADGGYVNPGTIGGEDLNGYGTWEDGGDYGAVWYPTNVAYDWQPYRNGHWTWVAPWGWTWIEAEPWGFAPFHYGRWNRFGDRWGWIPGPPVVRPVYSPALVAFVGGGSFSAGVTAWFPLGPREVYQPWYQTSPRYINRINVSNIYNRNINDVRNIYNQRTVVNNYNVDNRNYNYANRQGATVAVSHDNFAMGRRVDQSMVRVDPRQMAGAQVMAHPMVSPQRQMIVQTPARAVPPTMQRPVLASHEDTAIRPNPGGPRMQGGPVQPQGGPQRYQQQQQPGQQPMPGQQQQQQGRFPQNAPQNDMYNPRQAVDGQQPAQSGRQPQQPVQSQAPVQQQQPQRGQPQQPVQSQVPVQQQQPQRGQPQQPVQQTTPTVQQSAQQLQQQQRLQQQQQDQQRQQQVQQNQQDQQRQQQVQQQQRQQQAQQDQQRQQQQQDQQRQQQQQQQQQAQQQQQQQQRQLFNKAVPPEPRPSFDQQRQVMEQNEPGRPLNQQQLNNLRQNPAPAATPPPQSPPPQKEQARPDSQTPRGGPVKPTGPPKS